MVVLGRKRNSVSFCLKKWNIAEYFRVNSKRSEYSSRVFRHYSSLFCEAAIGWAGTRPDLSEPPQEISRDFIAESDVQLNVTCVECKQLFKDG